MTDREMALVELRLLCRLKDWEQAHSRADDVLCELLISLGYQDVVDVWNRVVK